MIPSAINGGGDGGAVGGVRRAVVQGHGDIAVEVALDSHGFLGPKKKRPPVDRGLERHPGFIDPVQPREAEYLVSPAVGKNCAIPSHKTMQASRTGN